MGSEMEQGQSKNGDVKEQPKKPYHTPELTVHGTVEQITQALGSGMKDGLTGSFLL